MLASGSLYLSSPLPVEKGDALISALETKVKALGQPSLRESSVQVIIQALKECNVNTMWIQEEEDLDNWATRPEQVEEVMIGDTEYEVNPFHRNTLVLGDPLLTASTVRYLEKWRRDH